MKTIRRVFWMVVGLALGLTIPWIFAGQACGSSFSLGGGQVAPHSYSSSYGLDRGWHFSVSVEDHFYENDRWDANVGVLCISSHYKRRENPPGQGRSSVDSSIAAVYAKPGVRLTEHLRPFAMLGIGANFSDGTNACTLVGGGIAYEIDKNWSLEGMFLYVWDNVKVFQVPSLSVRYSF